ncbi:cytochrome P450 [Terricaulis silvestris]|uniref:Cytochrome P450 n=1 Tax=Terricaulis silvestris TaxID=2686094 RepID=A0A6I6MH30_9CAUL|nr:cytochrome P450 [Terricaulis silvestris]QGZ93659.1 Cytochrome P450 [Terricaulis silvestris]
MKQVTSYTYSDPSVLENPFPFYAAMRAQEPVFREPATGVYFISRYDDVLFASRHPEIFSSRRSLIATDDAQIGAVREKGFADSISLTSSDPPEHQRFRALVVKVLTPRVFASLEPSIHALANRLIDAFAAEGQADLHAQFAVPLPLTVIADLLGFNRADLPQLKHWSDDYTVVLAAQACPVSREVMLSFARSLTDLQVYLSDVIKARLAAPGDDVVSRLLAVNAESEKPLDHAELVDMLRVFFIGGNETTTVAISNTLFHLLSDPALYARVANEPSLISTAVEESLRCQAPTQWVLRTVMQDVELSDTTIPAGSRVCLLWGSANRDEAKFNADSDRFDLDRTSDSKHIAFGFGPHFCAGSALARAELKIALTTLFSRLKHLRLAEAPQFNPHPIVRGVKRLQVSFDTA